MIETRHPFVFWLVWVAASWAGLILGMGIGNWGLFLVLASARCGELVYNDPSCSIWGYVALGLGGLICGGVIGLFQSWVLRRKQIVSSARWIVASMLGWMTGTLIGMGVLPIVVGSPAGNPVRYGWIALAYGIVGAVIGGMQWPVIRSHLKQSAWWIPATIVATALWGLASAVTGGNLITWGIRGAVTGSVLVWLVGHRSCATSAAQWPPNMT
jgi:hypothetical protein